MEPGLETPLGGEVGLPDPGPGSAFGVLFAPSKTFRALAARPRFVVPMVLLLVMGIVVGSMIFAKIDPDEQRTQIREQMEKQGFAGQELEDKTEQAAGFMEKYGAVFGVVGAIVGMVVLLVASLLFWGGLRLSGSTGLTFVQSLSTTFHGYMPGVVKAVVTLPVLLARDTLSIESAQSGQVLTSSLASFAPEGASAVTRVLLGAVDVFSIWTVILLIFGFSIVAKVSRGKAAAVVLSLWALGLLILVGLASLR